MRSMSVSSCGCCMFVCIMWQFSMLHDLQFVNTPEAVSWLPYRYVTCLLHAVAVSVWYVCCYVQMC